MGESGGINRANVSVMYEYCEYKRDAAEMFVVGGAESRELKIII